MNLQARTAIGGNKPEPDTSIVDRLGADYGELGETIEALANRANAAPKEINDDATVSLVSDLVKEITAAAKRAEAARVDEKEPHLQAERQVDGFFKALTTRCANMKGALESRVTSYLRRKADEERRRNEEIARQAREEQERRLREAQEAEDAQKPVEASVALDGAVEAGDRAAAALEANQVKPAELARTRGQASLATLKEEWVFEISDYAAIPLEKLRPYLHRADVEKAIRKFVSVGNRELAGVIILKTERAVVR